MIPKIAIQKEDFDLGDEVSALSLRSGDCGAVISFVGLCRGERERLRGLEIEAFPEMAENEIAAILADAGRRWEMTGATVVHRYGCIPAGGQIVLAAVASVHRSDAFLAAQFIMDFLKQRAPFWKRELHAAENGAGAWVKSRHADEIALRRWRYSHD